MPRLPIDYSKTIIYKLCCKDPNVIEIYVGHTTDFVVRKNCHKQCCNNINKKEYHRKLYTYIRENGEWENWSMIEIEKYPCNSVYEARAKEQEYIINLHSTLNSIIPNRTAKEYRDDKKDEISIYNKQRYETNKIDIYEYQQIYRESNKILLAEKAREFRLNNKEKVAENDRLRYLKKKNEKNNIVI
jgi:hypothetical protein